MPTMTGIGQFDTLVSAVAVSTNPTAILDGGGSRHNVFYLDYTKGDEATISVAVAFSEDGSTNWKTDPSRTVTITGTGKHRIGVEPQGGHYHYVRLTITPNTSGTGTVTVYARRGSSRYPFRNFGPGETPPTPAFPQRNTGPQGANDGQYGVPSHAGSIVNPTDFAKRWGDLLGTSGSPVTPPTSSPTPVTFTVGRTAHASLESAVVLNSDTSVTVIVEVKANGDWFEYQRRTYSADDSFHELVEDIAQWETELRVSAIRVGATGDCTLHTRGRAFAPALFG